MMRNIRLTELMDEQARCPPGIVMMPSSTAAVTKSSSSLPKDSSTLRRLLREAKEGCIRMALQLSSWVTSNSLFPLLKRLEGGEIMLSASKNTSSMLLHELISEDTNTYNGCLRQCSIPERISKINLCGINSVKKLQIEIRSVFDVVHVLSR